MMTSINRQEQKQPRQGSRTYKEANPLCCEMSPTMTRTTFMHVPLITATKYTRCLEISLVKYSKNNAVNNVYEGNYKILLKENKI